MDDILITHATVVTVDSSNHILRDAAIAIREREIVAVGPTDVVSAERTASEVIDARGMVAMPGLVNGHIHMFTALYKGTMCGFGFDRTMGEDIDFCGIATPDLMRAASRLSAVEMLRSGITLANVAGDSAVFEVTCQTPEALGQAGMRAFVQPMLADMFGMINMSAEAQLTQAEMLLREYQGKFEGRIHVTPGLGEALATSLKMMRRLAVIAAREDLIQHIHVFPRWPIGAFSWLLRGHSPLGLLKAGGLLNQRLVAVHFLAATRADIAAVAKAGASVVHCPSVWMNVNIGPRHWLPVKALHRAGVNLVLGTDSYGGWIEGADMFTEMRTCALVSSFLYGADALKPTDILRMATVNGARALGLEKETGSLEVGKRADIVLLKFDRPPVQPASDVAAMIVYGASGRDVETVLIDGRVVVRGGRVLTLDEREVVTAATEARAELYRRGGWELTPDSATPPKTSWLERYPNPRLAEWGKRFARLQGVWNRREDHR